MAIPLPLILAGGSVLNKGMNWLGQYISGEIGDYFSKRRFNRELQATNAMALKFEREKYKAQVEGMKEAGINPAITSAFSMGWVARN